MDTKEVNLEKKEDRSGDDGKKSESDDDCDIYENLDEALNPSPVLNDDREIYEEKDDEGSADDYGLYDNLDVVAKEIAAQELEFKVKLLEDRCANADRKNEELSQELNSVKKQNLALRQNISSVLKTARAQLDRKDRELKDLQRKYDLIVFRRGSARLPREPRPALTEGAESVSTKADSLLGQNHNKKTTVLPEGIEYSFQMGKVSVCFSMEHENFRKKREEHLEFIATEISVKEESSAKIIDQLEEGEVDDQSNEHSNPCNTPLSSEENNRERTRRSKSPTSSNKRKRSASPENRRHRAKLRHSPAREPEGKHGLRSRRSPRKSDHYDQTSHKSRSRSSHHASRFYN